jgi:hypothetical protein
MSMTIKNISRPYGTEIICSSPVLPLKKVSANRHRLNAARIIFPKIAH